MSEIQDYPDELDYVNATLRSRGSELKSFLCVFCEACLRADGDNYVMLRGPLLQLMRKYPARPAHLAMERIDSGRELPGDRALVDEADKDEKL